MPRGFVSVLGEAVRNLLRKDVTGRFPFGDPVPVPENYRGAPEVNPELCIVCGICAKECPTHCITITEAPDKEAPEGKVAYEFSIKMAQCMFCQTCEEFCPISKSKGESAIKMTGRWLLANYTVDATVETKIVYKKAPKAKCEE